MVKIIKSILVFTMGLLCLESDPGICYAKTVTANTTTDSANRTAIREVQSTDSASNNQFRESHDLSTFDIDVLLGYKNAFIKMAGIGAGIHRSIHSGNNFIPLYAVVRTNFRNRPSLFFFNLQAGYSFNTLSDSGTVGDFYGALGLGINLQQTKMSKTYVILSGSYQYFSEDSKIKTDIDSNYIFFAKLVIGVNF